MTFPKLRERYGQAAIDSILRVVAQTLENALRPTDFLGRWMEQEFSGHLDGMWRGRIAQGRLAPRANGSAFGSYLLGRAPSRNHRHRRIDCARS